MAPLLAEEIHHFATGASADPNPDDDVVAGSVFEKIWPLSVRSLVLFSWTAGLPDSLNVLLGPELERARGESRDGRVARGKGGGHGAARAGARGQVRPAFPFPLSITIDERRTPAFQTNR